MIFKELTKNPSSFRDPSGFVFEQGGHIYRCIDQRYAADFDQLNKSGLLSKLHDEGLLISHESVKIDHALPHVCEVIKPKRIPVITYPYEWCFGQLKAAAQTTIRILKIALEHNMILKDASAFNVQFFGYQPVFIDTLSFERYKPGQPWNGYRQFCEHFLGPLFLASQTGIELMSLWKTGVEGVPLNLASKLLPVASWLKPSSLFHIHLHAKTIRKFSHASAVKNQRVVSKLNLEAMTDHLGRIVEDIKLKRSEATQWKNYDKETHYSESGKASKASALKEFITRINPAVIWDLGSNDGFYSRLMLKDASIVLSIDGDWLAVEKNFEEINRLKILNLYPMVQDLTNPSSGQGWDNSERGALHERSRADLIVALALLHHLVIVHNIPFEKICEFTARRAPWLVVEFVPKEDGKILDLPNTAGKLLYSREAFEKAFLECYEKIEEIKIADSGRSLLLLKKK